MSFEGFDDAYWRLYGDSHGSEFDLYVKLREFAPVARFLRGGPPGAVLDVGCGLGAHVDVLRAHGLAAFGAEPSAVGVARARARGVAGVVRATGTALPIASGALAGVLVSDVLNTLTAADSRRLVAEARRVLAPGGRLVVVTPNLASHGARRRYLDPNHRQAVDAPGLFALLEAEGFAVRVEAPHVPGGFAGVGILARRRALRPIAYGAMRAYALATRRRLRLVAYAEKARL